jgi:tetratricopeptide (TPR) repeat protein
MSRQLGRNRVRILSATLVAAFASLRFLGALAAEPKAASKEQHSAGASSANLQGRVTNEAGNPLADVRVRVAIPAADMRFVDCSTQNRQVQTRSNAKGEYRLELPGITKATEVSIDAMKPGYRRLVGTLMSGGDDRTVEVAPGKTVEASFTLKPALYFAGIVVDENGKPIGGVTIGADVAAAGASGGIERTASSPDGSFELFNFPNEPVSLDDGVTKRGASKGVVSFFHPDYIADQIEDVYALLAKKERFHLRVVLRAGHKLTGTVLDRAGKPVPYATIQVRQGGCICKGVVTDANGRFALHGLPDGLAILSARALQVKQKIQRPINVDGDRDGLNVRLKAIPFPRDMKSYAVLGMQLTDLTPELRSAYDLDDERGAVILDPGPNSDRLQIGRLAEGYCFWMVGDTRVGSVYDFVKQILGEADHQHTRVRVVYSFSTPDFDGTNTQYLKLTKDDVKQLEVVSRQLKAAARPATPALRKGATELNAADAKRSPAALVAIYYSRGNQWLTKGEADKALAEYNAALLIDPQAMLPYYGRGLAWFTKRDYDKALADFNEAIRLDPQFADAYLDRGRVWCIQKRFEKGVADYSEAIRLDPKDPKPLNNRAWLAATCPDAKFRNGTQAVADSTKACELTGWRSSEYLDTLAAARAETGDFASALKLQLQAVELAKGDSKAEFRSRIEVYKAHKPYRDQ